MFFSDRWVFFALTINWFDPAETDPDTVAAFATAVKQALNLVFERLP